MEGKRLPPLLNLSRLKAAAAKGTGPGIATGAPATWGEDATSSSCICARGATGATTTSGPSTTTLFDARRELAADLQRREARRAQARAEAADTEGEASVLAALRAVHRLRRDAGEKKRESESFWELERRDFVFSIASCTCRGEQSGFKKRRSPPFR